MRSGGNNFHYFTENQLTNFFWPTVSATAGILVNFCHTLSVGLLVRPWPYRPYRRRRPCIDGEEQSEIVLMTACVLA